MKPWYEQDHEWDVTPEKISEWTAVQQAFQGKLGKKREWVRSSCPMCIESEGKDDYKESLGYHLRSGKYRCFKCGVWGYLPISFRQELSDDPDMELLLDVPEEPRPPPQTATGFVALFDEPGLSSSSLDWARDYLRRPVNAKPRGRGLPDEVSRTAGLGAALWGPLGGRVIVPVPNYADPNGSWRGWVARAVFEGPEVLPYRNAKHMDRTGLLYNEPELYRDTREPIYVVEGCFDALSLWPDAVAVLGKVIDSQMPLLLAAKRPIAVALDGDAYEQAQQLAWSLQHYGKMAVALRLPAKQDPDDLGKLALRVLYDRTLASMA